MATFTSLPLEMRHEIYSYLLIAENVSPRKVGAKVSRFEYDYRYGVNRFMLEANVQPTKPVYAVSLFRVSKQISEEALDFFCKKNAFSILHLRWSQRAFTRLNPAMLRYVSLSTIIPQRRQLVLGEERFPVNIYFTGAENYRGETGRTDTFVTPASKLDLLIKIFNSQLNRQSVQGLWVKVDLRCNLERYIYGSPDRLQEIVAVSLQSLRHPAGIQKHNFGFSMTGSFDPVLLRRIKTEVFRAYSLEEMVKVCERQVKFSEDLFAARRPDSAMRESTCVDLLIEMALDCYHHEGFQSLLHQMRNLTLKSLLMRSLWLLRFNERALGVAFIAIALHQINRYSRAIGRFSSNTDSIFHTGITLFPVDPFEEPIERAWEAVDTWRLRSSHKSTQLRHLSIVTLEMVEEQISKTKKEFLRSYPAYLGELEETSTHA